MSKARFIFNMSNKTVGPRTSETDKYPLTYPLIDDETANAVVKGVVTGDAVAEAIRKGIMSKPGFNWEDFDKRRQAEKKLLNMSQHDMIPMSEKEGANAEPDKPEEVATLASLGLGNAAKAEAKPKATAAPKKETHAKFSTSAVDSALGNY